MRVLLTTVLLVSLGVTMSAQSTATEPAPSPAPIELKGGDGRFNAMIAAYVGATAADISVSMYQINRGVARERGFGAGWQDSPVKFALTKGAMTALFVYGLKQMRKERPKSAMILGVAMTAVEGFLAYRSAQIEPIVVGR